MAVKKVRAILIVEIVGKPEEHVKASLVAHVENLKNFKNIKLIKYTAHEPKPIEIKEIEVKDLFSTFAEVEIEADNFIALMDLVFDFMPSSIEILEPLTLDFSLEEGTTILNRLAGRMHRYDEIAKISTMKSEQLQEQFNKFMQHLMQKKLEGKEIDDEEKKD
jgi:acyl-CoA synthetase (AMP-forming)/AMP-acid ligase II